MDAQPLMIVKPEDLSEVFLWLTITTIWLAAASGFVGYWVAQGLHRFTRWFRQRGASKPFAARAARLEQIRLRSFLHLDRICNRNARELQRRTDNVARMWRERSL